MPRGDRTGPRGMGAMTGRRMGNCVGTAVVNQNQGGFGRGSGFWNRGLGRGFGRLNYFGGGYAGNSAEEEINSLKNRIAELERRLSNK